LGDARPRGLSKGLLGGVVKCPLDIFRGLFCDGELEILAYIRCRIDGTYYLSMKESPDGDSISSFIVNFSIWRSRSE